MKLLPLALLAFLLRPEPNDAAQILGLFQHPGKSHFDFFRPMFLALAERGHNISMYNYFPLEKPVANYTDYVFQGMPLLTDIVDLSVGEVQVQLYFVIMYSLMNFRTLNPNGSPWDCRSRCPPTLCFTIGVCDPVRWP